MKKQSITLLTAALLGQLITSVPAFAVDNLYGVGTRTDVPERQIRQLQTQPALAPVDKGEVTLPAMPEEHRSKQMPDGSTLNPQFVLTKINFQGNTEISSRELEVLAREIEGKEIYFSDLIDFTVKVSRYYQSKGYLTSYAFVPEQQIKGGVVTIKIFESRNIKPGISGHRWANEWFLRNIVMGKRGLREGDVFNSRPLQWALKETNNDTTYIRTQTKVSKLKDTEETAVTLDVQDRFPLKLDLGVDNFGRDNTGRERFTATLGSQNLTGYGDKIYGGTVLSENSTGVIAGYSVPLSPYGTRLGYDFSYSDAYPGGPLKYLDIKGTSISHFISVTQPLVRTTKDDWTFKIGYDFFHTDSEIRLPPPVGGTLSDYNLRVLRTSFYGQHDDNSGRWFGNLGLDWGMDAFGASGKLPDGTTAEFTKFLAGAARVQKLPWNTIGILRANGQYSGDKLYPAEKFQIGGAFNLRGYEPAILIGDYGVSGTAELRVPVPGLKQLMDAMGCPNVSDRVKLGAFYDFGWVDNHSSNYDYPKNYLHSVGAAIYTNLTEWISAQAGFGVPLGTKYYDEGKIRFFFQVGTELDRLIPIQKKQKDLEIL